MPRLFHRTALCALVLCAGGHVGRISAAERPAALVRPNILLIVVDDLGWGDVSYHGSRIPTPNLDRLAREGVELDRHYVMPQCTPTRSSLLSGIWASRYDLTHSQGKANTGFPAGLRLLPEVMRDAGYTTLHAGKWHVGPAPGQRSWERGFEQTYGSLHGTSPVWRHSGTPGPDGDFWQRNGQPLTEVGVHTTDLLTAQAIAWLHEQAARPAPKPWFLYLAHFAPHTPLDPPKDWLAKFARADFAGDDAEAARAMRYAATVAHLDDAIGRVIAALEATGQRENTLVVFTSDNGPQIVPRDPTQNGGTAGELRGFKGTTYEGGIRVPALVSWPARLKPLKLDTPVLVVDWLPTFAALAGITVKTGPTLDGVDVWPLLTGSVATLAPRPLYLKYLGGMAALREGDWKLVTRGESRFARSLMVGADRADQLFNLTADPLERDDLAAARPEILARMQARLIEHMKGDAPAFADGTMQYWWSRVPEQQALIARRTAEVTAERAKQKSAAPR
jgi:arylsulfatase A-like enzyme